MGHKINHEISFGPFGVLVAISRLVPRGRKFRQQTHPGSGPGARAPFSTIIIVSEMTGGYYLLLPSLWVCTIALIFSDEQSIYSSQVEGRSRSPAHQGSYVLQVLAEVRTMDFLLAKEPIILLHSSDSLTTVLDRLSSVPYPVLPVVDGDSQLLGVVNLEEVHQASQEPTLKPLILAADLMLSDIRPLTPNDTLDKMLELFVENDLLALLVVNDLHQRRVIGMVRRFEIASAYCATSTGRLCPANGGQCHAR